jgi:2-polyprenyl-3-methyl-5-hydroxy-6-metoxy-1,4-benzoquinol methylase
LREEFLVVPRRVLGEGESTAGFLKLMHDADVTSTTKQATRPRYVDYRDMQEISTTHAVSFARQILHTCNADLPKEVAELDVLDVGSGYGPTAAILAGSCRSVVGIEPTLELHRAAERLAEGVANLTFRHCGVETLADVKKYDLIVLDNVFEHLADQADALRRIDRALRPEGVVYLLMPNRLWPVEAHYGLPFLAWLPLRWANLYLQFSGRGDDYTDASYAPTLRTLKRALRSQPTWTWRLTLPADPSATHAGNPLHYRLGMRLLRRMPFLWVISKSFLVVVKKNENIAQ